MDFAFRNCLSDVCSFQTIPIISRWVHPVRVFDGFGGAFSLIFTGALVYILVLTNATMAVVLFIWFISLSGYLHPMVHFIG